VVSAASDIQEIKILDIPLTRPLRNPLRFTLTLKYIILMTTCIIIESCCKFRPKLRLHYRWRARGAHQSGSLACLPCTLQTSAMSSSMSKKDRRGLALCTLARHVHDVAQLRVSTFLTLWKRSHVTAI